MEAAVAAAAAVAGCTIDAPKELWAVGGLGTWTVQRQPVRWEIVHAGSSIAKQVVQSEAVAKQNRGWRQRAAAVAARKKLPLDACWWTSTPETWREEEEFRPGAPGGELINC